MLFPIRFQPLLEWSLLPSNTLHITLKQNNLSQWGWDVDQIKNVYMGFIKLVNTHCTIYQISWIRKKNVLTSPFWGLRCQKRSNSRFWVWKNIVYSLFKNIQCTDCWCCYLVHKYASLETHCIGYKDWQVLVQFFVFPKYKRPFKKRCNACNKGYHAMVEICSYSSFILFLEQYWLWTFKLGI